MDSRTLKWRTVGPAVLVVHGRRMPDEAEWAAFIAHCMGAAGIADRALVFADVSLNAEQRRQIQQVHRHTNTNAVAVVTSSLLTRALITTMNWMRDNHRAFAPRDVHAALDFLSLDAGDRAEILRLATEFAHELDLTQLEHTLRAA